MDTDLMGRLREKLWKERDSLSRWQAVLVRCCRYLFALLRDLMEGELSMRAMSLVYTTLLSIVPLLALGFSVLKALGAHNSLEPVLEEFLKPLGPQAVEVSTTVVAFVEKIQVGVLGFLGVFLLFYTAISLIQKVEASFNYIWRIEHNRSLAKRIGEYFGVLMVGPTLVVAALGITATILKSSFVTGIAAYQPFGSLIFAVARLIPYVIIVALFSFMYMFLVNTRVTWRAAFAGGLTAGVLWQTSSLLFAKFVANAGNYNAIYSGFAIVIFLLILFHVGWLILLIGCQLAFYVQNPRHLESVRQTPPIAGRETEYLALTIMAMSAQRFIRGEPGPTHDELVQAIDAAPQNVTHTIGLLIQCRYLIEAGESGTQLMPARDLDTIRLGDLWRAVRSGGDTLKIRGPLGHRIAAFIDGAETRLDGDGGDISLRAWLGQAEA